MQYNLSTYHVFQKLDEDNDGYLNTNELEIFLALIGFKQPKTLQKDKYNFNDVIDFFIKDNTEETEEDDTQLDDDITEFIDLKFLSGMFGKQTGSLNKICEIIENV